MRRRLILFGLLLVVVGTPLMTSASEGAATEPNVSILFYETDLRDALSELVMLTGVNIVADDTVHGRVTLDLQDVPLEQALRMMLLGGGYVLRKVDDFYLVGLPDPRGPAFFHLADTETVRVRHMTAGEALRRLPGLYDPYVRADADDYAMTIMAPPSVIERFKADLRRIDVPRKMVTLQLVVTEVSEEGLREIGTRLLRFTAEGGDLHLRLEDDDVVGLSVDAFSLVRGGELLAQLQALHGENKANLRANPQVTVVDGEAATLFVGERQVIILQPDGAGSRLQEVDVGVLLEVTPKIVGDDDILLFVRPEVSHFVNDRAGRRDDRFAVRRNEVTTTVLLQDGETALIAGMTMTKTDGQVRKVPILGDIPLLGLLFRETTEREAERELLIFVTARVEQ